MVEEPFMEHPTGEYGSALEAMEVAISRLRALPEWNRWITFCAQGGLEPGEKERAGREDESEVAGFDLRMGREVRP